MRKRAFCICENKDADQLCGAFVFATRIVQSLYILNTKFQASSHLLWLCSPIFVGYGRKPRRPVFSIVYFTAISLDEVVMLGVFLVGNPEDRFFTKRLIYNLDL